MDKWIYKKTKNNEYRFVLGKMGDSNGPVFICVGINPSTAESELLDPTLKRVEQFAKQNNCGSWIMLNVYPQRATNPNGIELHANTVMVKRNLRCIRRIIRKYKNRAVIVFAYGNLITKRRYLDNCKTDIIRVIKRIKCKSPIMCLGKTKKNNPRHPLYLKKTTQLQKY